MTYQENFHGEEPQFLEWLRELEERDVLEVVILYHDVSEAISYFDLLPLNELRAYLDNSLLQLLRLLNAYL